MLHFRATIAKSIILTPGLPGQLNNVGGLELLGSAFPPDTPPGQAVGSNQWIFKGVLDDK